jgi:hypothetical protein
LRAVELESVLRFPEDERVHEVCRMLRSSVPCYLKLERAPELTEIEFRQKQQLRLLTICRRSLACPVGRGMLTIGTMEPLMAEALPIPPLVLAGRAPPNNSLLQLDLTTAPADLKLWPEFHNGVAAALRVGPSEALLSPSSTFSSSSSSSSTSGRRVTRNWIIYNKTASQAKGGDGANGHAGFLLGMGLFGHLNVLTITDICEYLTQGNEPTTIGVLIGVSASKIGSANALLSKTLCLHLPTLLPSQHSDIEISPLIQCSALVGLGFLYCRSGHRLMVQFLLEELSRKPTSDRCECREALALSAAWSLAMVLLPKKIPDKSIRNSTGNVRNSSINSVPSTPVRSSNVEKMNISDAAIRSIAANGDLIDDGNDSPPEENEVLKSLSDMKIEECLHLLIDGGSRPSNQTSTFGSIPSSTTLPHVHHATNNYDNSAKSSKILESDHINRDVTSPGACLALGLIYLGKICFFSDLFYWFLPCCRFQSS